MSDELLISLISLIGSVTAPIVSALSHLLTKKDLRRNEAKQAILQMILEDRFYWQNYKKIPLNYQNILDEYEVYHKKGGNGLISKKVEEYKIWIDSIEEELKKGSNNA